MLGHSDHAEAEAQQAYATELGKPWHQAIPNGDAALSAASGAAERARTRTGEHLMAMRLEQLRDQSRPKPVQNAPWSRRLFELAARPLHGESSEATV
ncbi:hypothetical protein [Streptomyces sp. NBC_00342]|uniref:hypothetical protein n=1 Tax=Streptomyces sp. NBC_00342 TaxID=2975718 RepID=UPI002E2838C5|nr:hypothetical protein [Streptomyces sp. NBC_00342]